MENKLKIIRESKNLKQTEIAQKVGISVMSYFRYETGEREPKARIAIKIAKALDTTVEDLFSDSLLQEDAE